MKNSNYNDIFNKLPMESKARIYYTGCKASEDFSTKMVEMLSGILNPKPKERIIIDIYCSVHCWLRTIVALNNTIHFQAVTAAARTMFEHLLDLKLLIDNKIVNDIAKFDAFQELEKFKAAKKLSDVAKKYPNSNIMGHEKRIEIANNPEIAKRTKEFRKLWGDEKQRIKHWSGLSIEQRAQTADQKYEFLYAESFSIFSWYVHSGQVGTRNMSKEALELSYINSLRFIHKFYLDIVQLTADVLKLSIALPAFKELHEQLRLIPGSAIIKEGTKFFSKTDGKNK